MANRRLPWRIDATDPDNHTMRAQVPLNPGEVILEEDVLGHVHVGLAKTHDRNAFFKPNHKLSGMEAMERMKEDMNLRRRKIFVGLRSVNRSTCSIMEKNSFDVNFYLEGQEYLTYMVYQNISRINHSCRPNAVVVHPVAHPFVEQSDMRATLRAIRNIDRDDEILVDYRPREQDALQPKRKRQLDLQKNWGFDCDCSACQEPAREDNAQRRSAFDLYKSMSEEGTRNNETAMQAINRKIDDGGEYVSLLIDLKLKDHKLANAYVKLSELAEESFAICNAGGVGPGGAAQNQCHICAGDRGLRGHLDEARAWNAEAVERFAICSGIEHPDTVEARERETALMMMRAHIRAPSL